MDSRKAKHKKLIETKGWFTKRTRRGYGKKNENKRKKGEKNIKLKILGTNANGLLKKQESLKSLINEYKPSIITIQESKTRKQGLIKLKGYQIFEKIRKNCMGGGLLTAIEEDLEPVLISTGEDEENELITVQINVAGEAIRIINAYGPQEDENDQKILSFWTEIENEIVNSKENNCLTVLQMDANAKVGNGEIKNDPHEASNNGKILIEMIKRQNMTIANAMDLCNGVVTRERLANGKVEQSVIDYIVVCEAMKEYLEEMIIDDQRIHVLTKYLAKGKTVSDHNILMGTFNLKFNRKLSKPRIEIFNFKDKENQESFLEETCATNNLSASFIKGRSFLHNSNKFLANLKNTFHTCFKKTRITSGVCNNYGEKSLQGLLKLRMKLSMDAKNCKDNTEKQLIEERLENVEKLLKDNFAAKTAEVIKEHFDTMKLSEGKFSQNGLWKLKQKFLPRPLDPPMAKMDENGLLITSPNLIKELYLQTYKHRLRSRQIKDDLWDIFFLKLELWNSRHDELLNKKSEPWKLEELEKVLKSLKTNKTRDPLGMINEVFKTGCAGIDLKIALIELYNGIKENQVIPEYMNHSNITTIYKQKGSKLSLNSDRGIFILTSLKRILDKLIYFDKFSHIDQNMSDSNIGSRRDRNIKNHLFMIYGIINSVVRGNEDCVDIQIYDIEKAFDGLWLEDCLNDVYDALPSTERDDKLATLYESNRRNMVAVKTAVGMTDRVDMPNIVQQGGTWGPGLCSNSVDTLGKKCRDREQHIYHYKKKSKVLIFAMCDDLNGVARCGLESVALNTFITTQIELKKLRFHVPDKKGKSKCHKIHVGKNHETCPVLKVHGSIMEKVTHDNYLGDIISADGKNTLNIKSRVAKGLGIITQITNLLSHINLGEFYVEIIVLLRESMFINGILTNAEVWYNLNKDDIKALEDLDLVLLRKVMKVPYTTPKEAYYLELGILSIGTIIKMRRVKYVHYILNRSKDDMLYRFFLTQLQYPTPGDWTEQVKQDFEDLGIPFNFELIQKKSKNQFKNFVKIKTEEYELNRMQEKQTKHSKMNNLSYDEMKTQGYLQTEGITTEEALNLFKWRVRMAPVGENFRAGQSSTVCPLCSTHLDNQAMTINCVKIQQIVKTNIKIEDIYNKDIPLKVAQELLKISKARMKLVKDKNIQKHPSAQSDTSAARIT